MNINTNRRDALKGAAIAAIGIAVPAAVGGASVAAASPPIDRSEWDAAFSQFKRLEAEAEAYDRNTFDPLYEAECAFDARHRASIEDWESADWDARRRALAQVEGFQASRVPEAINDEHDRLWDVASNAKWRVMEVPAPDHAALRWKLEVMLEDESDHALQVAFADIGRLLPASG